MKREQEFMDEVKKEKDNVVPMLAYASPRGPEGPWLLNHPEGSMIVVKDLTNIKNFATPVFTILHKTDKTVRLVNPNKNFDERIDPIRFCTQWGYVETLCIVDLTKVLTEEDTEDKDTLNGEKE